MATDSESLTRTDQVKHVLEAHAGEWLKVGDVAKEVGCSPSLIYNVARGLSDVIDSYRGAVRLRTESDEPVPVPAAPEREPEPAQEEGSAQVSIGDRSVPSLGEVLTVTGLRMENGHVVIDMADESGKRYSVFHRGGG